MCTNANKTYRITEQSESTDLRQGQILENTLSYSVQESFKKLLERDQETDDLQFNGHFLVKGIYFSDNI